jgi:hypothetical protein
MKSRVEESRVSFVPGTVFAVVCLLVIALAVKRLAARVKSHTAQNALSSITAISIGIVLWSTLWFQTVPYELRKGTPQVYVGYVWPVMTACAQMLACDSECLTHLSAGTRTSMSWEASALIGLSFTVASVSQSHVESRTLATLPVILCLCFVTAMPLLHDSSREAKLCAVIHKWCVNCAAGMIITAIVAYALAKVQPPPVKT